MKVAIIKKLDNFMFVINKYLPAPPEARLPKGPIGTSAIAFSDPM